MSMADQNPGTQQEFKGLSASEVLENRQKFGENKGIKGGNPLLKSMISAATEPMFLLLAAACILYFILQETTEAFTLLAALLFVAGIDVFQNFRSSKAVKALSQMTQSRAKVIREGKEMEIQASEIVMADVMVCEEGNLIPADGKILASNDFAINEAILTGESVAVEKFTEDSVLQGTLVVRGYCYAKVTGIGLNTTLAGIGGLVESQEDQKTPLQLKVANFVRTMVIAGGLAFAFVWAWHWWDSGSIIHGLLNGLTMAMSVLPEEIPVALSTFMAIGAYRLYRKGVIARSPKTVETLGSATVICLDKTGTLTQNLMQVAVVHDWKSGKSLDFRQKGEPNEVLEYAMWSSEESPFDPMEISIHEQYEQFYPEDRRKEFHMAHEYPLAGKPPAMTHCFENEQGERIIACKGALEGVLNLVGISGELRKKILEEGSNLASQGLRVLGVAKGSWDKEKYPEQESEIDFEFLGLVTFYDPPAENIPKVIRGFQDAGIQVKMITGDYRETAIAIAREVGIPTDTALTGDEVAALSDKALREKVGKTAVFARISPEAKLRIVDALKAEGETVAMTGDGVNDAPALKSAHIGVAMGKRGTEVAKGAAGLILSGDDLSRMIDAIFLGRRINSNLIKAIRYIISIHIPIILLVTLPIFFGWLPAMLFTPVHVIFLELLMGPTCSIIYENEPTPESELQKPARKNQRSLFSGPQLFLTIVQGLMITVACLVAGFYAHSKGMEIPQTRALIFTTLIFSNVFLTLFNRSFSHSVFQTLKMKNRLIPLIIGISLAALAGILFVPWLNAIFDVVPLEPVQIALAAGIALAGTAWVEGWKVIRKE